MKLYFMPGACSLSPHICLREVGAEVTLDRVRRSDRMTTSGLDYRTINPLGYVPALELPDGSVLTEGPAIVQWIADQHPAAKLAPENGTTPRYHFQSLLNFISTELHKSFTPLFADTPDDVKARFRQTILSRVAWLVPRLESGFVFGDHFTAADAYLFTVLSWARLTAVDLPDAATAYLARIAERPSVDAALRAEGLKK